MNSKGRETAQRLLAVIVIIAMLGVMGLPVSVIIFFATVTYFIWRAVQRSDNEDTRRIFEFYINADELLRDEEKTWYGFETANVIERGERILHSMADAPSLIHFALGALYNRSGEHQQAAEHLSFLLENPLADETRRYDPSPELRRYVEVLRKLEGSPAEAPRTIASLRNLERARRSRAATLLENSREKLNFSAAKQFSTVLQQELKEEPKLTVSESQVSLLQPRNHATPPPPSISDVLRDVYEEKKTA